MKIAVIGAGPTGLSAALHLVKTSRSCEVDLYEAAPEVGGLSRSFYLFDHIVDLGPHRFFTQDKKIMDFWYELTEGRCHKVERQTSILYNNRHIGYPIKAADLLRALPLTTKFKIFNSFLKRKKYQNQDGKNFSTTMRYRFGDSLYELFFKNYTERLWGVADTDLSASVAYQRIGGFGLSQAIGHALKSLLSQVDDSFMYPETGCGQVWQTACEHFLNYGGNLHTSTPVMAIEKKDKGYLLTTAKGSRQYDFVLNTMPLSQFISIYKNGPTWLAEQAQKLKFRSTVLVYVEVNGASRFKDQWIYINSENISTGRITNFSNWGIQKNDSQATHVLCLEYWCTSKDELWNQEDPLWHDMARQDLIKIGYSELQLRRFQTYRLPNTYPVITNESEAFMESFAQELESHKHLHTVGRGGAFKYNNQDHCIEMGLRAAKSVLGEVTNVWAVNSAKSYHEIDLVKNPVPPG